MSLAGARGTTVAMGEPNFYAGGAIDRASHFRDEPAWIAARLVDPESRAVPVWRAQNLAVLTPEPAVVVPRLVSIDADAEVIFLGLDGGQACFAVDWGDVDEAEAQRRAADLAPGGAFVDLRRIGPLLPRSDGALLATARGIVHWHRRTRFCGVCGSPTAARQAGHMRACTGSGCGATHFPRTDPATIMLVTDGDRCLLGRQKVWPTGRYSTLAGFVEPGESLEDAVAREVFEESGIRVANVTYHSSQPWPFPSSLMVGFFAEATSRDIRLDQDELEDAQWFTAEELRRFADLGRSLPNRDSIARRLVETWLAAQS